MPGIRFWLGGWLVLVAATVHAADARPPNIVLLLVDDLGYGSLGCYGQQQIATPRLDRMASEGLKFTQMYAGSHVCQPSRCVLMTGMHTGHAAVRANDVDQLLLPEDITVAEVLKSAGYETAHFGKWGLGYEGTSGHPRQQGFDRYFGQLLQVHAHFQYVGWLWDNEQPYQLTENHGRKQVRYTQDEVQARALDWIGERDGKKPFFAYLSYILPHVELVVPEDSKAPYRGKFPNRAILDGRPGYLDSPEDGLATFAGMISRLDRYAGEVLDLLREKGWDDNTVVIFTSDNGGQNGGVNQGWTGMTDFFHANGDYRGYKSMWYEGGIRVPFLVRWPRQIPAGKTVDTVAGFQDVLPTLAEVGGAPIPPNLDGLSLLPTWLGQKQQPGHEFLYWEYPARWNLGVSRAARMMQWKAIQKPPLQSVELYDLLADPAEKVDVSSQHPEIVAEMLRRMDQEHRPPRQYPPASFKPQIDQFVK